MTYIKLQLLSSPDKFKICWLPWFEVRGDHLITFLPVTWTASGNNISPIGLSAF